MGGWRARLRHAEKPRVLCRARKQGLQQHLPRRNTFQLFLPSFKTQSWENGSSWLNMDLLACVVGGPHQDHTRFLLLEIRMLLGRRSGWWEGKKKGRRRGKKKSWVLGNSLVQPHFTGEGLWLEEWNGLFKFTDECKSNQVWEPGFPSFQLGASFQSRCLWKQCQQPPSAVLTRVWPKCAGQSGCTRFEEFKIALHLDSAFNWRSNHWHF